MTHEMLFIVSMFSNYKFILQPHPLIVLDTPKSLVMASNQSELSELARIYSFKLSLFNKLLL